MSTRTVERVDDWESVPFAGGYDGLRTLADQGFSGAVVAGPTRLFMLNGTVVGVLDGSIEDFESASGTAREAPHEALPLLAVMQERADEVRAQYYTQDTPVADVDKTLSDGNFTGYVELSENVLSGDYYMVYHQGRSMGVAWVGSSEKLITDDEALEQANDEVGIYEVKPVDIEPVEIPEPAGATDDGGAAAADPTATDATPEPDPTPSDGSTESPTDEQPVGDPGSGAAGSTETAGGQPGPAAGGPPGSKAGGASQGTAGRNAPDRGRRQPPQRDTERAASETSEPRDSPDPEPNAAEPEPDRRDGAQTDRRSTRTETRTEPATEQTASTERREPARSDRRSAAESQSPTASQPTERAQTEPAPSSPAEQTPAGTTDRAVDGADTEPASTDDASGESGAVAASLETRSIPSLDPDRSASPTSQESAGTATPARQESTESDTQRPTSQKSRQQTRGANTEERSRQPRTTETTADRTEQQGSQRRTEPDGQQARSGGRAQGNGRTQPSGADPARVEELESELADRDAEVSRLESELADLADETEELRRERDRLESELEDARAEIERLEASAETSDSPTAGTRLSAAEAIDATNLFVRYHSKGEATLEKAHDGDIGRDQVEENLRLEYHTQFDDGDAAVDGEPFEAFLHDTIQYRFVDWLVRNLLYEIRDTGHAGAMQTLYDALPAIDRAELNGKVSVTYTENGEQHRSQEQFDVVVRDRMGNPLIVANINDTRQPATDDQMTTLVQNAERVGNASETLAAAFLVTSSFFEPEALETAEGATSSGLFSRDKRKSFVNLSRKDGYHLCLLEARDKEFHLAVPEL